MNDAIGRKLGKGDLVVYCPQNSYSVHMAIVVDPEKGTILSSGVQDDGSLRWISSKTGNAHGNKLFIVARYLETDDYEEINDQFHEALEKMGIKL